MPDETIGLDSVVEVNDGAGDAFEVIPQIESFDAGGESVGVVDSKRLDLDDGVIVKIPALKDPETVTLTVQMVLGTYERLEVHRQARSERQWRFTINNLTQYTVPGFITRLNKGTVEPDGLVRFTCEIQCSGKTDM